MKSLREKYFEASNETLIKIIEEPEDYTKECIQTISNILKERRIPQEEMSSIAREFMTERIREIVKKFSPFNGQIHLPFSNFIPREERMEILQTEFKEWMMRKGDMEIDVYKYVVGAIL
jgi:hypothetical protein